jgi:ribosomal protein L7/L12
VDSFDSSDKRKVEALRPAQRALLQDLMAQDKKIEAIKQLRTWTGLGLKEAKDEVDAIAQGGADAADGTPYRTASEYESPSASGGYMQRAQKLVDAGSLLDAIKLVRDETNCSLLDAKNQVESMRRGALPNDPVVRKEATGSVWLVLFLIFLVAAVAILMSRYYR